MRLLGLLAIPLLLSGCIQLALDTDSARSAECRQGSGLFVKAQHHPGFTGPEHQLMFYTLERDGRLTFFRAHDAHAFTGRASNGQVRATGPMHNITLEQVKAEMQRVGAYSTSRDYNVSIAWRHTVSAPLFESFCAEVLQEFYSYRARYDNNMIADCDAFELTIATHHGTHSSYSYCRTGPQDVREAFDRMRDEAWKRFGVAGL